MPNNVKNELYINGEEETVSFIFDVIKGIGTDNFIDFNKIIPAPAFMFNESAGRKQEELSHKFNTPIWTKFNRENWGTKWGAYSQEKINDNQLNYQTAWNSSRKVIKIVADKFPMVEIILKYADEYTGANVGIITWYNGKTIENIPNNGSIAAYDIYFELNPEDKKYYKLIEGEYQHIEDE